MSISSTMKILVPCWLEIQEKNTKEASNFTSDHPFHITYHNKNIESIHNMKINRNVLYISAALTIIAFIGALTATGIKFYALTTVTLLSGRLTAFTYKKIDELAPFLMAVLDRRCYECEMSILNGNPS